VGRGEGAVTAHYGESVGQALMQIESVSQAIAEGATREALTQLLPPGSARNAIDCALWSLEASLAAGQTRPAPDPELAPLLTAQTIGIDTPDRMGEEAHRLCDAGLLKVKLDARDPAACLRAVRTGAPDATIIADANEAWSIELLASLQVLLHDLGVAFVEQPLRAGEDAELEWFDRAVPICADESCHTAEDLPRLERRYDLVNIKLDKTGGLTEALHLLTEARRRNLGVMVGCMISSSLSIAPAFHVAKLADYADLDGPLWLANDWEGGVALGAGGYLNPPSPTIWRRT
jgi:L-alanine-DL-glutamate epimerase-like enolase superfamily enzyme